jgi:ABC-2 type transport system ATP-binding protein
MGWREGMIELKSIGVQFSGRDILKDVSVLFNPEEIIGLVAPNGTGKSTLMNVIMNYVNPNSGKVILNNALEYTNKKNEVKIHQLVSMMPDQSDLYNQISGKEHLKIYSSMWNSNPKLIDSTIRELGMASYINKHTGTYSLGMRQRLCFAMQIVSDTQVMLMDEVMNGLDPTHVELISRILVKKKSEGKTVIVASHLLENLEKYADRIFFMKNGELLLVNDLSPGFDEKEITTVRVAEVTDKVNEKLSSEFPDTNVRLLPNGATLIDVRGYDSSKLGNVVEFLKENQITEFSFGKVTLNDLYSMYYQEG